MAEKNLWNDRWEFLEVPIVGDAETIVMTPPEEGFRGITLPHDWLIEDAMNLYRDSIGWYRKTFTAHPEADKEYLVRFDGVYMDSAVYVNGQFVMEWKYGYSTFEADLTPYLKEGENRIVVRVVNQYLNTRWYSGAGIYRNVWWKERRRDHIISDGIYITPVKERDGLWQVEIETEVCLGAGDGSYTLKQSILSPDGMTAAQGTVLVGAQGKRQSGKMTEEQDMCRAGETAEEQDTRQSGKMTEEQDMCRAGETAKEQDTHQSGKVTEEQDVHRDETAVRVSAADGDLSGTHGDRQTVPQILEVRDPALWDIGQGRIYRLVTKLYHGDILLETEEQDFGFRTIEFIPDKGFFINGRHEKIRGVCEHHDLGCLGAAFYKDAMRRKFQILRSMGVNAVRTSHNMPAPEVMELADEMGFLIDSEAFDMWEKSKTPYDYGRFFKEWYAKDVASWIRRDRNHPSVIMWSIGNEIPDTVESARGQEITADLLKEVQRNDPKKHAPVTIGSNFLKWDPAVACTELLDLAGYNYSEYLYDKHHKEHPNWVIYGSETASVLASRGIYHFPKSRHILTEEDEQCSALGNSITGWGAVSYDSCITADRDASYSPGQFLWTGFDYIGESTPYQTRNSYFGQLDTAGFPKDSYYIFQAEWTDYKTVPMVHVFPYWDFNPGQTVDLQVCSNAPCVELFVNGKSLGRRKIDHRHGRELVQCYQAAYEQGSIEAVAYDEEGHAIAREVRHSFGDAAAIHAEAECVGRLAFISISARDADGYPVENANNRIFARVTGDGRLLGMDSGDSTDFEDYWRQDKRLFSGKLLAVVEQSGGQDCCVELSSYGLKGCRVVLGGEYSTGESICVVEDLSRGRNIDQRDGRNDDGLKDSGNIDQRDGRNDDGLKDGGNIDQRDGRNDDGLKDGGNIDQRDGRSDDGLKDGGNIDQGDGWSGDALADGRNAGWENDERSVDIQELPVRKIELTAEGSRHLTPEHPQVFVRMKLFPTALHPQTYDTLEWKAVNDAGIELPFVEVERAAEGLLVSAHYDGMFRLRVTAKNGKRSADVMSHLEMDASGFGESIIDPYQEVLAALSTDRNPQAVEGVDHGINCLGEPEEGKHAVFGFERVDFGSSGTEEITVYLFANTDHAVSLKIWDGEPNKEGSRLLVDGKYHKKPEWMVFQPMTYRLSQRLMGERQLYFETEDGYQFKSFLFTKVQKAYEGVCAADCDRIYGDSFQKTETAVEKIGNNVGIVFERFDLGEERADRIAVRGRTSLDVQPIQIRWTPEVPPLAQDSPASQGIQMISFERAEEYKERIFAIEALRGRGTLEFIFLPGSSFDFMEFRFLKERENG